MKQGRRYQYLAAFGVSLATMTNASVFFWTAPILPKLLNNEAGFNMTSSEASWVVAVILPGSVMGSVVAGFIADTLGRRATLLGSAFPIITGTVIILCAFKAWLLYMGRFFWGCGSGMISTISSMYLSEIADKEIRGALSVSCRIMFNFGATIVLIIGSSVSYTSLNYVMFGLVVCYFCACWFIPETPYFLLKKGKVDKARKEMKKLTGLKDEMEIEEKVRMMRADVRRETLRSGSVKELFTGRQYRKAIIISVGVRGTQMLAGTVPIQQYLGTIIMESNAGIELSTALIVFGITRFVVAILSSAIIDKVGRRPLFIYSYIGTSIMLAVNGTYFFYQEAISHNQYLNRFRYFIFIGLLLCKVISNLGFDILVFTIVGEIFPLNVKATAMSIYNIFSSFVAFAVVRGHQVLRDMSGLHGVFWFYSTMALSGGIFCYFYLPETKGKSLSEIQMELQGEFYEEAGTKLDRVEATGTIVNKNKEDTELQQISGENDGLLNR